MAIFNSGNNSLQEHNKTLYEVVMIADQYGSPVTSGNPSGMAVDAFGRARSAQPVTLFDSSHRYQDNGKFATSNTSTATYSYNANTSMVSLNVDTTSGAKVVRESKRIFSYQPGKSLQILNTFVFNEAKENLRQRVGYFDTENGVFFQQSGNTKSFVLRSNITNTPTDEEINQSSWNIDTLDGNGPSKYVLDTSKAQIMFTDVEWLGVGTVRVGFVIDGQFIHCHSFHHANRISSTYMTTANLPVRYEIENTAEALSGSSLKQICSTVISEGGYEIRGKQRAVGTLLDTPKDIPTAGTFVPVVTIRLKSDRLNAIVTPKNIGLLGIGNNTRIKYAIIEGGTLSGGTTTFTSAGSDSNVEYNLGATAISGGNILHEGYLGITNQSTQSITLDGRPFAFQLERNGLTGVPTNFSLVATGAANGDDVLGSILWDEIT